MTTAALEQPRRRGALAWGVVGLLAQVAFAAGWVIAETWQGPRYSPVTDTISDLQAATAPHVWFPDRLLRRRGPRHLRLRRLRPAPGVGRSRPDRTLGHRPLRPGPRQLLPADPLPAVGPGMHRDRPAAQRRRSDRCHPERGRPLAARDHPPPAGAAAGPAAALECPRPAAARGGGRGPGRVRAAGSGAADRHLAGPRREGPGGRLPALACRRGGDPHPHLGRRGPLSPDRPWCTGR